MSDICHEHTKKRHRKHHSACDVIDILRKFRVKLRICFTHGWKPFRCSLIFFRIRESESKGEKLEALEAEEDAILARLMAEHAEEEGKKYNALNEQLQDIQPSAIPVNIEKRFLELIDEKLNY